MKELYAKSNKETLKEHTKKVIEAIEFLRGSKILNDDEFWNYLKKAAFVHDLGKVYKGFQDIVCGKKTPKNDNILSSIHSLISPIFIKWYEVIKNENWQRIFLSSIIFHHFRGKINNIVFGSDEEDLLLNITSEEFNKYLNELKNHLKELFDKDLSNLFLDEWDENLKSFRFFNLLIPPDNMMFLPEIATRRKGLDDGSIRKFIFFKGFLMRADHFASSEENDIRKIEIKMPEYQSVQNRIFEKVKSKNIWQLEKLKDIKNKNVILIGSTGIGKTEFAFLWGAKKKLVFTLPMRTMVDEVFKRASNIFDNKVGLLHGTSIVSLEDIKREDTYDINSIKLLSRELSFPVIIGTGDQIFPVALKYPGYEKIMSILGYSNLVIDEVQAYDAIASAIIVKTIEDTVKMGGNFLLMTATLPEYIREEINKRVGEKNFEEIKIFSKEGINTDITKHKIYTDEVKSLKKDKQVKYFLKYVSKIIKSNSDKKILIIVNTVKNAQTLYDEIKKLYKDVMLLHSRFISEDRKNKIDIITGKDKQNEKPKILITTQIVEASVDIDYDILVTEIAPLESLIQRMGRVNRNRGKYQEGCGDVYVWNGYLEGSNYVYKKELLAWTYEILKTQNNKDISEQQKQELLKKYYNGEAIKEIEKEFEKNLDALDNLYTADSKAEANKMFRDISSVNIIPSDYVRNIKDEIEKYKNRTKILRCLLKYTISKPKNWKDSYNSLSVQIESNNYKDLLDGYYISSEKYTYELGLTTKNYEEKESTSPAEKDND